MKYIWEEKDIVPGLFVGTPDDDGRISETRVYLIGYNPAAEDSKTHFCMTALCDGMVCHQGRTRDLLAKDLTEGSFIPLSARRVAKIANQLVAARQDGATETI